MKFAVVVFPGSNCDHDAYHAAKHVLGQDAEFIWHKDTTLQGADVVVLPIMQEVTRFASRGGPVLGICNGFQVLLEAGLLPGAMLRNRSVKFQCEHVYVKAEQTDTPFTVECRTGQVLRIQL